MQMRNKIVSVGVGKERLVIDLESQQHPRDTHRGIDYTYM